VAGRAVWQVLVRYRPLHLRRRRLSRPGALAEQAVADSPVDKFTERGVAAMFRIENSLA